MLTTLVLLTCFLLGAGSMGLVSKTGFIGRGGNVRHSHKWPQSAPALGSACLLCGSSLRLSGCQYISSHWDRNTADAHHALDVILDHLKHPELYEESPHGKKLMHQARGTITVSAITHGRKCRLS
jgi:hypothetical protein